MIKFRINQLAYLAGAFLVMLAASCKKDNDDVIPVNDTSGYSKGVFIINEGPFASGTGTITYLNRISGYHQQKIYQDANGGAVLGNIVQSMNYHPLASENAYICVNNANKVEVVNLKTFEKVQSFENVTSPRYVEFGLNGKMYVSCWDNTVKIYSTEGYESLGQVPAGTGPEKLMKVGNTIWVLNQGGFDIDSTVTIISTLSDEVLHTVEVYPKPSGIQLDDNGDVWILCSGKGWNGFPGEDDSEAHLLCMDPEDYSIIKDIPFPSVTEHPEDLVINREGDQLFYNHVNGIYRFDIHGSELEADPFIAREQMYYALGLDPEDNYLYASDPVDYVQNGWVYRYSVNNGALVDSLQAGIIPGEFFFTPLIIGD